MTDDKVPSSKPAATHSSIYRQQSVIRTRFDTVIASELGSISQLREKRQTLIHKIMQCLRLLREVKSQSAFK